MCSLLIRMAIIPNNGVISLYLMSQNCSMKNTIQNVGESIANHLMHYFFHFYTI